MTACLEKLDLQRVFRPPAPKRAQPAETADRAGDCRRPWRVVASDGSTSVFSRSEAAGPQAAAARGSRSARPSIAMPGAVTDLAAMLAADQTIAVGGAPAPLPKTVPANPAGPAPKTGRDRADHAVGSRARSLFFPKLSSRCREVDSRLARIIDLWPGLPRSIQAAVSVLIETAKDEAQGRG